MLFTNNKRTDGQLSFFNKKTMRQVSTYFQTLRIEDSPRWWHLSVLCMHFEQKSKKNLPPKKHTREKSNSLSTKTTDRLSRLEEGGGVGWGGVGVLEWDRWGCLAVEETNADKGRSISGWKTRLEGAKRLGVI